MSIKKLHVANILARAREAYNLRTDAALANFLKIDPSTVSTWRRRDTVDIPLLLTYCNDVSADWLLYGEGAPRTVDRYTTAYRTENQGRIPLLLAPVRAGEPMLASPEVAEMVDIGDIVHPAGSLLVRYTGNSLREYDINRGDLLTVATTATAERGDLVLTTLADGSVEVMQYEQLGEQGYLYPPGGGARIVVTDDVVLRGVVTSAYRIIKRLL